MNVIACSSTSRTFSTQLFGLLQLISSAAGLFSLFLFSRYFSLFALLHSEPCAGTAYVCVTQIRGGDDMLIAVIQRAGWTEQTLFTS